jgi:KaiC/GvpD/RAD55 family RecA-like ATPase
MSHYARNLAMPEPAVRGLMYEWNNALDEPMPDKEVDRILRSFPGYIYKCSDFIKARYCDKRCMEYSGQVEDGNKHLYTGEEFGSLIVEISKETDDDWIRLDKIYPHLTLSPIKPRHGHMSCIVGGSSCGKTTFVLEVMQNMKHINWLMLSYDMASSSMAYVMSKKNKIDPDKLEHDKQEQQRFANIMSNIAFLDDSSIALQDIERYYHQVCRKYRTKYNAIVIDYLGLVPTRGDAKERATQIAMKMKDFAKKNQVAIIFLVQVPKNMAGDANLYLGMDAAKDSGEIVNLADHVLTFWRPEKGGQDRILRANVAKDKYSAADYTVDLHWKGNHCIGNMPASYYNQ